MADLITLSEYKTSIGITSTTKDAQHTQAIAQVSEWIRSYCNRKFNDNTVQTEYFRGTSPFYYLKEFPNVSIISVNSSLDNQQVKTLLVPNTDYYIDPDTGSLETVNLLDFSSTSYFRFLEVVYTGGYTVLPDDLKLAVINLVTYFVQKEFKPRLSTGIHNKDNINESQEMPYYIQQTLDIYRTLDL